MKAKKIIFSLLTVALLLALCCCAFACSSSKKKDAEYDTANLPETLEDAAARLEAAGYRAEIHNYDDYAVGYVLAYEDETEVLCVTLFRSESAAKAINVRGGEPDSSFDQRFIYGSIGKWTYDGLPEALEVFKTPSKSK